MIRVEVIHEHIRYENVPVHYHVLSCDRHFRWFIFSCDGLDEGECGADGGRSDLCEFYPQKTQEAEEIIQHRQELKEKG